jgi:hypothetical protein
MTLSSVQIKAIRDLAVSRPISLKDIAEALGVSVTTAWKYTRDLPRVKRLHPTRVYCKNGHPLALTGYRHPRRGWRCRLCAIEAAAKQEATIAWWRERRAAAKSVTSRSSGRQTPPLGST